MTITLGGSEPGGGVASVFTRSGAVVAASGDYTVAQVTGAAPLASPALTGNPTTPTATAGDSDTSIASTAFVQTAIAAPQVSGTWTWDASPKTALTFTLAEGESLAIWVIVNVTYYRAATTSFASSVVRLLASGRRAIGGSAAVATAATLNAGNATTPTIAAAASGNDFNINVGLGIPTNEGVVVTYDVRHDLIRRTITY